MKHTVARAAILKVLLVKLQPVRGVDQGGDEEEVDRHDDFIPIGADALDGLTQGLVDR